MSRRNCQISDTVEFLQSELGEPTWDQGMNPDIPETKILDNPYQYTEFRTATTHTGEGGL